MKNKKILLLFLLLFLFFSFEAFAKKERELFCDGYDWEKWNKDGKIGYIIGLEEGLRIGEFAVLLAKEDTDLETSDKKIIEKFESWFNRHNHFEGVKFTHLIDNTDIIYKNHKNKNIPITKIMPLVSLRIKGEISSQEIEEKLSELRSVYK